MSKASQPRRADDDRKQGRQLNVFLTKAEGAAFETLKKKLNILPGTPETVIVRNVLRAGLKLYGVEVSI